MPEPQNRRDTKRIPASEPDEYRKRQRDGRDPNYDESAPDEVRASTMEPGRRWWDIELVDPASLSPAARQERERRRKAAAKLSEPPGTGQSLADVALWETRRRDASGEFYDRDDPSLNADERVRGDRRTKDIDLPSPKRR